MDGADTLHHRRSLLRAGIVGASLLLPAQVQAQAGSPVRDPYWTAVSAIYVRARFKIFRSGRWHEQSTITSRPAQPSVPDLSGIVIRSTEGYRLDQHASEVAERARAEERTMRERWGARPPVPILPDGQYHVHGDPSVMRHWVFVGLSVWANDVTGAVPDSGLSGGVRLFSILEDADFWRFGQHPGADARVVADVRRLSAAVLPAGADLAETMLEALDVLITRTFGQGRFAFLGRP